MLAIVQKSKFVCNGAKVEGHQQRCNIRRALATVQHSKDVGYGAIAESADLVEQQMDGRAMVVSQVYAAGVRGRIVERQQRTGGR